MLKIIKKMICLTLVGGLMLTSVDVSSLAKAEEKEITQFMDCFIPTPIMSPDGELSKTCWGAKDVGPRDQYNGLEDMNLQIRNEDDPEHDYVYWDGGIIKNDENGKYYMFASRWDGTTGSHYNWINSEAVYAVSDNLYGPYIDKGLLWPDNRNGIGHNIFPFKLKDNDESGYKYGIIACESRPADIFVSKSLDGPWVYATNIEEWVDAEVIENGYKVDGYYDHIGGAKKRFNVKNTVIIVRPDGKYEAFTRDGDIALADNICGPWTIASKWTLDPDDLNLWDTIPGMRAEKMEDPIIWYADGLYHCVVNQWDTTYAVYLTSTDGITDWTIHPGMAYMPQEPFLKYENGTVCKWNKIERPNVYIENDEVVAMTFAVTDVAKWDENANDNHGSKIIVAAFDGKALNEYNKKENVIFKRNNEGLNAVADTNSQSWLENDGNESKDEYYKNYGKRNFMYVQKCLSGKLGEFAEYSNENGQRNAQDSKIAFIKFDLSDYKQEDIEYAELSLVYLGRTAGGDETDQLRVALAGSDWQEGTSNGEKEEGALCWYNQPEINYDADDVDNTTVLSEEFSTLLTPFEINIDITPIIENHDPNESEITLAINETKGQTLSFASKEMNGDCGPKLIIDGGYIAPTPEPTATPQNTNNPVVNETPAPVMSSQPPVSSDASGSNGNNIIKTKTFSVKGIKYKVIGSKGDLVTVTGMTGKKKIVNIPASVKYNNMTYKVARINKNAFKNAKNLTRVTIGKNVKKIGNKAFFGCKNLKKVVIKNKKVKIGKKAFAKTSL